MAGDVSPVAMFSSVTKIVTISRSPPLNRGIRPGWRDYHSTLTDA